VLFAADGYVSVYDTHSGRTEHPVKGHPVSVALTRTHLAYASGHGVVKWLDLATGKATTLYTTMPEPGPSLVRVVAHGSHVAWFIRPGHRSPTPIYATRDMSNGKTVHLPFEPYAINSAGVLMKQDSDIDNTIATWFAPFGGTTQVLMPARVFTQLPQLVGHALAWVSVDGNLKVAPYSF
jgi:hypothetical protein